MTGPDSVWRCPQCSSGRCAGVRRLNAWGIRGSRRGYISIERRRRYTEAMRDLRHSNIGIGQHRFGGLDVIVGEFRVDAPRCGRPAEQQQGSLGCAPGSGCARTPLTHQTWEKPAGPARSSCRGLRSGCETQCLSAAGLRWCRSKGSVAKRMARGDGKARSRGPGHVGCQGAPL